MDNIDNNKFEVKPVNSKRKTPCPNVYLNPALDLLANEDPMCNNAMEIVPIKKRKRTKSDIAAFENSALDLGISKAAVNEFLVRELENVRKNIRNDNSIETINETNIEPNEPIYANVTELPEVKNVNETKKECSEISTIFNNSEIDSGISVLEQKSLNVATINNVTNDENVSVNATNIQTNFTNQIFMNNTSNLSLSFIDRLALDSPDVSSQSLYLDDDLNESNIMEIKTITIITKKKLIKKNTNPFLDPNLNETDVTIPAQNPFLNDDVSKPELEYSEEMLHKPVETNMEPSHLMPRRLFSGDTNSTISTVNESMITENQNEYENMDSYRSESPIYENADEIDTNFNKQSKILGYDVSQFSAVDIMNLNKNKVNSSNESNDNKKDLKHHFMKASNKLSKKVLKTFKKTFKTDKVSNDVTLNPYEVPRKPPKNKVVEIEAGIENPCLNLDNSDEIEIEEIEDEEHQYETIKTIRNTRLNMNVTPLKERVIDNINVSHNKTCTPGKKVRFDSTLNQEKVITGNSFDFGIQSPGFDAKIEKYHDELENCINERKFLEQNM